MLVGTSSSSFFFKNVILKRHSPNYLFWQHKDWMLVIITKPYWRWLLCVNVLPLVCVSFCSSPPLPRVCSLLFWHFNISLRSALSHLPIVNYLLCRCFSDFCFQWMVDVCQISRCLVFVMRTIVWGSVLALIKCSRFFMWYPTWLGK